MMAPAKGHPWIGSLVDYLTGQRTHVFSRNDLADIVGQLRHDLRIPSSLSIGGILSILTEDGPVREVEIRREGTKSTRGTIIRYVLGNASPFRIGLSLRGGSYLSHSTALFIHALTDQVPKTIYVNREQSPKPTRKGSLSQFSIDRAFKNAPRKSKYVFVSRDYRYVLLSGKHTGRLEVVDVEGPDGESLDVTNIERTLVDIVVRPAYSGGVHEVLQAYTNAKGRVSINTLRAVLKKLDYLYPYHQSIGFLLERGGYAERDVDKFRSIGMDWDFYLDYGMEGPAFDAAWRLYYPKGL